MTAITQPKAKRLIDEIVIHCTATPEGRHVSLETVRGWHKDLGWADIGYHWLVLLDGTVVAGRPEAKVGAHVSGRNATTLGVAYVGGVAKDGKTAKDTRTPAQKAALLSHTKALLARYPTIGKVSGHNQYAAKACPSFDVRKDELGKLLDKPKPAPAPAAPKPVASVSPVTAAPAPKPVPAPEPPPAPTLWSRIVAFFSRS